MDYYGAAELAASFRTVRKNTILAAEEIAESDYGFRAAPTTRTVAEVLAHIAVGTQWQYERHAEQRITTFVGVDFFGLMRRWAAEEQKLRAKAEILAALATHGERWAGFLASLTEADLAARITFPEGSVPPSKSRFELLLGVKEHEMHHRGQLMVLQRLLGQVPHLTRQREARAAAAQATREGT
jgi:uncharacterized damage-inducible protein DinB